MNIAITGHRGATQATEELIDTAIRRRLAEHRGDELVGLSCIADGADSIFAQAALDAGGSLVAIFPAAEYRDGYPPSTTRPTIPCSPRRPKWSASTTKSRPPSRTWTQAST